MTSHRQKHLVIIEAYQGILEFLSDEPEELAAAQGLGLPVGEIAEQLDCRITVLCWDDWLRYERSHGSPFTWVQKPVTRPPSPRPFDHSESVFQSDRVRRVPIPAREPVLGRPFSEVGFSAQSHGLIANNDLMFFVSYCLRGELAAFHRQDPFDAILLPMWGGLGYLFQMTRATGAEPLVDVPCAVVTTDTSARRQTANQEGCWMLEATIRRQMEDLSLALADAVLVFGPRGAAIATAGRLPDAAPPVIALRRVDRSVLDRIAMAAANPSDATAPAGFFIDEPQQPASGMLVALDGAALLNRRGIRLERPMICSGPPMVFAPMMPRNFRDYWSSRGFVRELVERGQWRWEHERAPLGGAYPVRLYPSLFEHLPDVWTELARGSLVLLSPAAAEGLAPGESLPDELLIGDEPTAEQLADRLQNLAACGVPALDRLRRRLCSQVVAAHRGEARKRFLDATAAALERLLRAAPNPQDLSRVARLLVDRRRPLRELDTVEPRRPVPPAPSGARKGTLSVVVTCYEMGPLVRESVESVWASDRVPDEILLVNDGSHGEPTLQSIRELEEAAGRRRLPLRVIHQDNMGLAGARNTGLAVASGEFVSFLDGDDLIDPRFYRLALGLVERHPDLGGAAAWAYCVQGTERIGFWNAPQPELPSLFIENGVIVPCLVNTEFLRGLSGCDTGQRYNYEDWELSIRILASGRPIVTIPMYLMDYRVRAESLYRTMTEIQNQVMREHLLATHRETASKFGPEIAMLIENRLMRLHARREEASVEADAPTIGTLWVRVLERTARSVVGASRRHLKRLPLARWFETAHKSKRNR
ncbi:MAG: glycosyltransferase [Nitrospirae bacterium]|nr:glycosyltransferase [Nitrospirota bacterium]